MNAFIFTLGTRGDIQPFVALGKGLRASGHRAVICTDSRFRRFITQHGLEAAEFNDLFSELIDSSAGRDVMENSGTLWQVAKRIPKLLKLSARMQQALMDDGWQATQAANPDLVIYHPKAFGGSHFAEKLNVPAVMALPLPMYAATGEFPVIGFPRWPFGPIYNRATYGVLKRLTRMITGKCVTAWRRKHALPVMRGAGYMDRTRDGRPIHLLHGYSRHVAPIPADWPPHAEATGYWFLDHPADWKPSPTLASFLESGPAPVYVGFGSMSGNRAQERARVVVSALERVGVRGVIAAGWGGLSAGDLPSTILPIDEAPHDWLFPRMRAVVHHGGAGTTAAGLRAGRPTIICPFLGDQPFWGKCIHDRGFGPAPIPQRKLTVDKLANAIQKACHDRGMQDKAAEVARQLKAETGVKNAVERLEKILAEG